MRGARQADKAAARGDPPPPLGVLFTIKENIDLVGTPTTQGTKAAALATGMTPLGLGNDGSGSLRWPVQCCGVASLRPTIGRISHATTGDLIDMPICGQLLEVQGPLARHIADLQTAYALLAGPTWRDPWTVPAPLRGADPPKPIRVALVVNPAGQEVATQVKEGVLKSARSCAFGRSL